MDFFLQNWGAGFVAYYATRFADTLAKQGEEIMREKGWKTPPLSVSTVLYLHAQNGASVTDISNAVGSSHQLTAQRIKELEKLNLAKRVPNKNDKRSRLIMLTPIGQEEAEELGKFMQEVQQIFSQLETEIGCNLSEKIIEAERCMQKNTLKDRLLKN